MGPHLKTVGIERPSPHSKGEIMKAKARVLVVDDEPHIRDVFSKLLTIAGYKVDTAKDGEESIKLVKRTNYNIIFMDVKLPGINGLEAYLSIKNINPEPTVVMMTGYAVENLVREAIRKGACGCIYKPFNINEILDVIEKSLGSRGKGIKKK